MGAGLTALTMERITALRAAAQFLWEKAAADTL